MASHLDHSYEIWAASKADIDLNNMMRETVNYARRIVYTSDREYADDLAQSAGLHVWRYIQTFDPSKSSFTNFVRLSAKSVLSRHLAAKYDSPYFENIDDTEPVFDEDDDDDADRLVNAFGEDRHLLHLLLSETSIKDASKALGISYKAVRHKLDKARKRAQSLVSPR